jgi:hypothetical protein
MLVWADIMPVIAAWQVVGCGPLAGALAGALVGRADRAITVAVVVAVTE